jgi:hypothetical protein
VTGAPDMKKQPLVVVIAAARWAGVVHSLVTSGATVFLVERDELAASRARERVLSSLARHDTSLNPAHAPVHVTVGLPVCDHMGGGPDLALETVPEHIVLK